jgi:hypothetical protein
MTVKLMGFEAFTLAVFSTLHLTASRCCRCW